MLCSIDRERSIINELLLLTKKCYKEDTKMNTAILHSPKKSSADYSATKIKKPVLVKSLRSSKAVIKNYVENTEAQTYTFVGIAG